MKTECATFFAPTAVAHGLTTGKNIALPAARVPAVATAILDFLGDGAWFHIKYRHPTKVTNHGFGSQAMVWFPLVRNDAATKVPGTC